MVEKAVPSRAEMLEQAILNATGICYPISTRDLGAVGAMKARCREYSVSSLGFVLETAVKNEFRAIANSYGILVV